MLIKIFKENLNLKSIYLKPANDICKMILLGEGGIMFFGEMVHFQDGLHLKVAKQCDVRPPDPYCFIALTPILTFFARLTAIAQLDLATQSSVLFVAPMKINQQVVSEIIVITFHPSSKATGCQFECVIVHMCIVCLFEFVRLFVCISDDSSETADSNELKFCGMISFGLQIALGLRIRPNVPRKTDI